MNDTGKPIQFRFPEEIENRLRAAAFKSKTTLNAIVTQSLDLTLPLEGGEESQLNQSNLAQYRQNLHGQLNDVLKLAQALSNQSWLGTQKPRSDATLIIMQEEEKKIQALCKRIFFFDRFNEEQS